MEGASDAGSILTSRSPKSYLSKSVEDLAERANQQTGLMIISKIY